MKRARSFASRLRALIVLAGFCAACATTSPSGVGGAAVTIAETCAVKATHDVAVSIIGDVNTALAAAASGWDGALASLAAKWGIDAVKCAVAEVTNASNGRAMASGDGLEALKASRGRAWLAAH